MKIGSLTPTPRPYCKPTQDTTSEPTTMLDRVTLGGVFLEGAMPGLGAFGNGMAMVFGADWNGTSAIGALANVAGTAALMGGIPGGKLAAAGLLGLSGAIMAHTFTTGALDN